MSQGLYQTKPPLPFVPGVEAAGVVVAVGEGVEDLRPGQRVVAGVQGAFAERVVARATHTVGLPDAIDFVTAAGMMMTYGTAYHALVDRAALRHGETLLVTGAGGGVGIAAVALGKALGARVIATASAQAKREAALHAGAAVALDANAADLVERMKAETSGGFDVLLDNVGARFDTALRAAAWRARLLIVGFAGGRSRKFRPIACCSKSSTCAASTGAIGPRAIRTPIGSTSRRCSRWSRRARSSPRSTRPTTSIKRRAR